jgi:Type VI secretion system, TssO
MQPKNVIERKKSFFNFLLLFVLSTAVIVLLSFFSTRVPLTHNELLQKEVEVSDHEKEFSKHFMSQMTGVMSMLDTIDTKVINADLLDGQISTGITKLSGMVENDSVYNKDLYRSIVLNLSDLQRAKQQLRKETAAGTDIN